MTADEVRLLDNKYALLFIRGERPIIDLKYEILNHPNVKDTTDGNEKPYIHGGVENSVGKIDFDSIYENILQNQEIEITDSDYLLLSNEEIEELI